VILLCLYGSSFGWVIATGQRRRGAVSRMGYLDVAHTMEQTFGTGGRAKNKEQR
jgi:hypothetical protein